MSLHAPVIRLERWTEADIPLLIRLNAPDMTVHLGGPESVEQLNRRLRNYVASTTPAARMFKVVVDGGDAGSVGFWDREWKGEQVYETGWSILPEFQGRGVATRATAVAIEAARDLRRHDAVHAYPSIDNFASNAICRKLDFRLLGECELEYPRGRWMSCNDWRLGLR